MNRLPLGIFFRNGDEVITRELMDNDFLIMVTDGVLDAFSAGNYEEMLCQYLQDMRDCVPAEVAQRILQFALKCSGGHIKDDTARYRHRRTHKSRSAAAGHNGDAPFVAISKHSGDLFCRADLDQALRHAVNTFKFIVGIILADAVAEQRTLFANDGTKPGTVGLGHVFHSSSAPVLFALYCSISSIRWGRNSPASQQ